MFRAPVQALGERKISRERLQHVLPGANRAWAAHDRGGAALECAQQVGYQAVDSPVATADHIAGPSAGNAYARYRTRGGREERALIGGGDQFRTCLTVAIRIVAAEPVAFRVSVRAFKIFVAFVTCHVDHGAHAADLANRVEHVNGAHHIGPVRVDRVHIRAPDQRLRGEVKHHFGPRGVHSVAYGGQIPHVAANGLHTPRHLGFCE